MMGRLFGEDELVSVLSGHPAYRFVPGTGLVCTGCGEPLEPNRDGAAAALRAHQLGTLADPTRTL